MCLVAAILPWVVDLFNSLGYTIAIRSSEEAQGIDRSAAAPPVASSFSSSSSSASSSSTPAFYSCSSSPRSSAVAEGGGGRSAASRPGMTAASLQMKTIGPYGQTALEKENDSKQSNNRGVESNANMVALSTTTTTTTAASPADTISPASPSGSNGGRSSSRTCCFCWCCCCSCSCITVQNGGNQGPCPTPGKKPEGPDVPHKVEDAPTPDELKAWGESFDKLMQSTKGREKFREFLRSEYSEENVLFWLACEELKKQTNPETIEERARSIYEDYISILSPKEVSLDSRAREVINRNMVHPSPHTFDDAQLQIYTLMHRDSYPRFLNSNIYKRLLASQ